MRDWLADTRELQEGTYGYDFAGMPLGEKIAYIKDMAYALEDEVHEATGEIGWKPWATERFINRAAYIGECVDIGHFLANMLVAVECTDEEWAEAYHEKRTRNKKRQDDGYTGLDKCADCRRAFDDIAAKTSERLGKSFAAADLKRVVVRPTGPVTVCLQCKAGA